MGRENESGRGSIRGDHERAWQRAWTMIRQGKAGEEGARWEGRMRVEGAM